MIEISDSHILLGFSLASMAVGPLVYQMARVVRSMLAALDGFVFVAIGGLVLFHIVPDSIGQAGWVAVFAALAGLMLPSFVAHKLHGLARQAHVVALLLGLAALTLHGFTDGLTLASSAYGERHHAHTLPMAVVLHRLPVGLTIWFLLRPVYGLIPALAALVIMTWATIAGFVFGESVAGAMESQTWGIFQAVVAGSLLHVVLHRSYPLVYPESVGQTSKRNDTQSGRSHKGAGLGGLVGLALLALLNHDLAPEISQGMEAFIALALQSAPALLFAYVAAGVVYVVLPQTSVNWMRRGWAFSQSVRGMSFGLPLPICSCGVVPVYRSLAMQGVPATAGMAFLVATPELSLDAILISLPMLGGEMTVARIIAAGAVALIIGWVLGRKVAPILGSAPKENSVEVSNTSGDRLRRFNDSFWEVIDTTGPWIVIGLSLAAVIEPMHTRWIDLLPTGFGQVELFALLGIPVYVCASGATPLVAVLIYKGISPGAALAFLLTGPATNVTTFGILSQLHGRWVALAFGGAITGLAVLAGHVVNILLPVIDSNPFNTAHASFSMIQEISLFGLSLAVGYSLLRRGPRKFVGELFETGAEEETENGDCHDHEKEMVSIVGETECSTCADVADHNSAE